MADYKPEVKAAALREEILAREKNGFVRQTDWWKINSERTKIGCSNVVIESFQDFLISATKDVRHVAVLLSPEAHLDPYNLKPIFQAAPIDGSTFLSNYVYGIADILETHYASGSPFAHHPFVKDGQPQWTTSAFGAGDLESAARLVGTSEKKFSFDCGRKQLLYLALEQDLEHHGVKPSWFVPAAELLPFDGTEPDCAFTFWDSDVYRTPKNYSRPYVEDVMAPSNPKEGSIFSKLWPSNVRH
ncbi:MAG: hypothetical protein ABJ327_25945 [Litoreibacter sp.]